MISNPNRHPVIRFFISSTFSDMERERDILRVIFQELKPKYKEKGWQLDVVDLRWGINHLEGLDNKTMSICLGEIEHCQTVSPRPNFIMLVGEYFGWLPLPEEIKFSEMDRMSLSSSQIALFKEWYVRDDNYLDEPRYVLKGREGKYIDNTVFHEEVEKPLSKALFPITRGLSATQQEIMKGMESEDAQDHVIAYVRTLKKAPTSYSSSGFRETISQTLLRRIVKKQLGNHHYIAPTFNFSDYSFGKEDRALYDSFKKHITEVIEKEIEASVKKPLDYEVSEHFEHADALANEFVGRDDEIKQILEYVNNSEADTALWIKGPAGVGKSALVSKIAAINGYNKTTIIFCGLTEKSSSPSEIEKTIHERVRPLTSYKGRTKDGKIIPLDHGFPWLTVSSPARHLFIIDNAGGIKDAYLQNIFPRGEKGVYAPGIKVIFTSTEGDSFYPGGYIKEMPIRELGLADSQKVIAGSLSAHGRKISESQKQELSHQLEDAKRTGWYLKLLSQSLSSIRSWESLPVYPKDTIGLSDELIRKIVADDDKYGYGAAPIVLSAFSMDRIGLNDEEILGLLLSDSTFWNKLSRSSFHTLTDKSVPPIVWARLYARIKPFLINTYNKYGSFYTLSSKELRNDISKALIKTNKGAELLYRCWEYYKDNAHNTHLASQTLYAGYKTLVAYLSLCGRNEEFYRVLSRIIETSFLNLEFISVAYSIDRNDTLAILDKVLSEILSDDTAGLIPKWSFTLSKVRKKLGNLSAVYSPEATLLALGVLPGCYSSRIVPNQFAFMSWHSAIIDTLSSPTYLSRLTSDGKSVVIVKPDNGRTLVYSYTIGKTGQIEQLLFDIKEKATSVDINDDANTICVCGQKKAYFYVGGQVYECEYSADDTNVSTNGETILLAKENEIIVFKDLKSIIHKATQQGGRLSQDGKWAWAFTDETDLSRFSTAPHVEEMSFTFAGDASDFGVEKKIVACSEHYCILSAFGGVRYSDRGYILHYDENTGNLQMRKFPLFVHDRPGRVWINDTEDKMLVYERANLLLWELHPIMFVACVEIDFIIDVTPDFTLLLSQKGQIISLQELLRANRFLAYAEVGVNAINYSEQNDSFIVSVGKNNNEEFYPQYHSIIKSDGRWTMRHHIMTKCEFISASAISNKGDIYAICKCDDGNSIEIRDIVDNSIIGTTKELPFPCTAIRFTDDDQHIVAAIGYYADELSLLMPEEYHYYMFDRTGGTELDVKSESSMPISYWIWSVGTNFIVTENLEIIDTSDGSIIELKDDLNHISFPWTLFREWHFFGHMLMRGPISAEEYQHHSNSVSAPCLVVVGATIYYSTEDNVIEFNPKTKERVSWGINEKVVCASNKGLYTIDKEDTLYYRDFNSKKPVLIEHDVQYAAVSPDNEMLYVSLKNGVLLFKKNNELLGVAFLGSSYDMHVTKNGLVGSNREGELFYFDASKL